MSSNKKRKTGITFMEMYSQFKRFMYADTNINCDHYYNESLLSKYKKNNQIVHGIVFVSHMNDVAKYMKNPTMNKIFIGVIYYMDIGSYRGEIVEVDEFSDRIYVEAKQIDANVLDEFDVESKKYGRIEKFREINKMQGNNFLRRIQQFMHTNALNDIHVLNTFERNSDFETFINSVNEK